MNTRTQDQSSLEIVPYLPAHEEEILDLTVRAWTPVFPLMKKEIPDFVYNAFYPEGWKKRQLVDVSAICGDSETEIWVATINGTMGGFMGLRVHDEDCMGEILIIAVDPDCQRQGICSALMAFAFDHFGQQDLKMVMVETGGDDGHAPSRATYESAGFERYPVARYFRKL